MATIKKYNGSTWENAVVRKYGSASDIITPPTTIYTDGTAITTYTIKGNTVQNGTPTPSAPVPVVGVGELETTGEHTGEYKIPISTAQGSAVNYLGSVQSYREIAKYVFDGTDNFTWTKSGTRNFSWFFNPLFLPDRGKEGTPFLCSHGATVTTLSEFVYGTVYADNTYNLGIFPSELTTVTELRQWLATQYANGTPVTIWYSLYTPTTAAVNEPLMKIGAYADTLSNAAQIPTTEGANSITVDTTVQPSEFTATWTGWHNAYVKEKSENLWGDTLEQGTISSSTGQLSSADNRVRSTNGLRLVAGTYTIATDSGKSVSARIYNLDGTYNRSGGFSGNPASFSLDDEYLVKFIIQYSNDSNLSPSDVQQIMLNSGSTALPYEPYWK